MPGLGVLVYCTQITHSCSHRVKQSMNVNVIARVSGNYSHLNWKWSNNSIPVDKQVPPISALIEDSRAEKQGRSCLGHHTPEQDAQGWSVLPPLSALWRWPQWWWQGCDPGIRILIATVPALISQVPRHLDFPSAWELQVTTRTLGGLFLTPHLALWSLGWTGPPESWVDQRVGGTILRGRRDAKHLQSSKWSLFWANCSTWTPLQIIVFNYHLCTLSHATYWCKITTTLV